MAKKNVRPPRGFARMFAWEVKAIGSMGGKASHASGKGHQFTSTEARRAGREGARIRWANWRAERAK